MSDKLVKRLLILIIFMGFVLTGSIITGTSYALLEENVKSETSNSISTGSIKVELTEYYDNINDINILNDEEGQISDKTYDFNIKNSGTAAAKYSLYLNNENESNSSIDNKYIKVSLEVNGERRGPFNLSEVNGELIKDEIINEKEVISFKMRIWLDETYQKELNISKESKTYLKLNVKASQIIDENDD